MGKTKRRSGDAVATGQTVLLKARTFAGETPSQANQEEDFFSVGAEEYITPPTDPSIWALAPEQSTRLRRSIDILARNVVGLGWEIAPGSIPGGKVPEGKEEQFQEEKALLEAFFSEPNDKMPFPEVAELAVIDCEATGDGYWEVTRNFSGVPDGFHHAQAVTTRVRKGGSGFVQGRGGAKRYFKDFGDKRIISAKTGKEAPGSLPHAERATELIHIKVYTPRSTHYGMPRYVSAAPAVAGNKLSALRNVSFFENDACPRMIITVAGGRLASGSVGLIEAFLRRDGKGVENAHRALLLQSDMKKITLGSENKVEIKVIPLTVGTVEDASFLQYRKANDEEIREAFGITEPYYSTTAATRAGAEVGRRVTEEGMFEPLRRRYEYRINQTIVKAFKCEVARFRFARPQTLDELESVNVSERLARSWALTVDEMRSRHGMPPHEDKKIGKMPFPLLALMGMAGGVLGVPKKSTATPGPKIGSENAVPKKEPQAMPNSGGPVEQKPRRVRRKSVDDSTNDLVKALGNFLREHGIEPVFDVSAPKTPAEAIQGLVQEE